MANATNVTAYDANNSTGVLVDTGLIKTIERLWIDTYVFSSAIPSGSSIDIAIIPKNARVTSIRLLFPSLSTGEAGTGSTISLGVRTGTQTGSTLFLSATDASTGVTELEANSPTGLGIAMTGSTNRIFMLFGRIATTTTAGTISTIVRYT